MYQEFLVFAQFIGSIFGGIFGFAIIFPKVGEALIGRLVAGSIEHQKAVYAKDLETHKQAMATQLEAVKKDLLFQLDLDRQRLSLDKTIIDLQRHYLNDIRIQTTMIYSEDVSDNEEKYRKVSGYIKYTRACSRYLTNNMKDKLSELYELIEEPSGLNSLSYCDRIDEQLLSIIDMIDSIQVMIGEKYES